MLDCYTFDGHVEFQTFTGPESFPVSFTLIRAEDADEGLLEQAAQALSKFLINYHYMSATIDDDE